VATSELLKSARLVKKRTQGTQKLTKTHLNDNGMLQSMLSGLHLALNSISTTSRRVRILPVYVDVNLDFWLVFVLGQSLATSQSTKKGLSPEEKAAKLLSWFHSTKEFYSLKEIEKAGVKATGLHSMQIKECDDVRMALRRSC
jgi:hypothetical protein